jgi:hypothetical protein
MNLKIFEAIGAEDISQLETKINAWIKETLKTGDFEIKHTGTALSQMNLLHDPVAHLVITVWWTKRSN